MLQLWKMGSLSQGFLVCQGKEQVQLRTMMITWSGTDACCNYCGNVSAQNFGEIFFSMCTKWYLLTFWPHGPHTSQHFSLDPHNLFASKQKNKNKNKKSKTSLLKTKESVFIGIYFYWDRK
jgi:hypothetical protein